MQSLPVANRSELIEILQQRGVAWALLDWSGEVICSNIGRRDLLIFVP